MTLTGLKKFFRSNRKKSQEDGTRKLTMSEIRQVFEENGYYHARAVFAPAEIAVMASEFDRIADQLEMTGEDTEVKFSGPEMSKIHSADDTIMHTHNVHQFSGAWLRAIQQDRFLDITQEILGENIMLHHSKLFRKPALHGLPFPMHQDWSYFLDSEPVWVCGVGDQSRRERGSSEFLGQGMVVCADGMVVHIRDGAPEVRISGSTGEISFEAQSVANLAGCREPVGGAGGNALA